MVKGVLFDLGGTLVDYLGDATDWRGMERRGLLGLHRYLSSLGLKLPADEFSERFFNILAQKWRRAVAGQESPTLESIIREIGEELSLPLLDGTLDQALDAYTGAISRLGRAFDDAAPTLQALKAAGLKIGLLSNTVWRPEHHIRDLERFGLLDFFDALTFSSAEGLWKPSRAAFHAALRRIGVAPSEAVFVGDRMIDDIHGAQSAGLKGVLKLSSIRADTDYEEGARRGVVPDARIVHLAELPPLLEDI